MILDFPPCKALSVHVSHHFNLPLLKKYIYELLIYRANLFIYYGHSSSEKFTQ